MLEIFAKWHQDHRESVLLEERRLKGKFILKTIELFLALSIILTSVPAAADDASALFVFKKDGEMPQVEASGVDRIGASNMHDLLGEDYVVFHGARAILSATSQHPIQPIDPDGIPDDDPLPLCQCPEDYRVGLGQRFSEPKMQDLLRQKQTVLSPRELPYLKADQIQALEQMIQKNGPLILQGQ